MNTRTTTEIQVWVLLLNRMTASKIEYCEPVAMSYDRQKLIDWYNNQKPEPWKDDNWNKNWPKGHKLEWYNSMFGDIEQVNDWGHGVREYWVTQEELNANMDKMIE